MRCDDSRLANTIEGYDIIAREYAQKWFDFAGLNEKLRCFADAVGNHDVILDAGCGPGRDAQGFYKLGFEVVGVDLSIEMLREATSRVPNVVFRRMDIMELRYPNQCFGGIWTSGVLHHLNANELRCALRELSRVLKPGGVLGMSVKHGSSEQSDSLGRYTRCLSKNEIFSLLAECSLNVVNHSTEVIPANATSTEKEWLWILARSQEEPAGETEECPLCVPNGFPTSRSFGSIGASAILWANADVYVVPDLAPVRDGHLLVVSNQHLSSFSHGSHEYLQRVEHLKSWVADLLKSVSDAPVIFFEHGPRTCGGHSGICIDHAHLHCVPMNEPLKHELDSRFGPPCGLRFRDLGNRPQPDQSYLYLHETTGEWYYSVDVAPSQLIRRILTVGPDSTGGRAWQDSASQEVVVRSRANTLHRLIGIADSPKHTAHLSQHA